MPDRWMGLGCDALFRSGGKSSLRVGIWTGTQMMRDDHQARAMGKNILSITKHGKYKELGVKKRLEGKSEH